MFKLKVILLAGCFIGFTNNVNAYSISRWQDGSVHIVGCETKTIGNTNYICCDDNCQTEDYWVNRAYKPNQKKVEYITDISEVEVVNRNVLTNIQVNFDEDNSLTSKVLGIIGL